MNTHRNIRILTWFNFFTEFKLYAPIAIIYFHSVTHSFALGMSIFAIVSITDAIAEVPTGIFSDMIGRRKTVILGAISSVLFTILYAIGGSYGILVLGAVFEGIAVAFYSGNNDALLHDSLQETHAQEEYQEHLGKVSMMFQLALAVAAIIGSALAHVSFAWIMWLSVISQVICLVLSFRLVEPRHAEEETENVYAHLKDAMNLFKKKKKLRLLSIASMLSHGIGEASFQFQSAFYHAVWPLWAIGFAKMLSYFGASVSFFFSGRLIKKYSEIRLLLTGGIYSRTVGIIATAFPSVFSPLLLSSTALFFGIGEVSKSALLQKEFSPRQRATMSSLNSLAGSIMYAIFSVCFGYIADRTNPAMALLVANICSFGTLASYFFVFRDDKQASNVRA